MEQLPSLLLCAVIGYLLGSVSAGILYSHLLGSDIRRHGSKNPGASNMLRIYGMNAGTITFIFDCAKAIGAVLLGRLIAGQNGAMAAGFFAIIGHNWPLYFGFKGGKGILSGGTIIIMIDWRVALVGWGGFVLLFLLTRYVSLGSSSTGIDLPIVTWFVYRDWVLLVLICIMGGLILWKHRSNIARLISGTESKFSFHRKAAG